MKPELFAGILLLAIIFAAIGNLCFLSALVTEITELCQAAEEEALQGNWTDAEDAAEHAISLWNDHKGYTQTVLRQSECDRAADILWKLLSAIRNREEGTANGLSDQVNEVFCHLLETERPLFSSIF